MNNIEFEELLGKHFSVFEKAIGNDFENKYFGENSYYINDETKVKDFFGFQYNHLWIQTDELEIVQSITINFKGKIDRAFYDAFNTVYGEPKSILVIEKRNIISEGVYGEDDFAFKARKSDLEMREGTFEEEPLWIIWEKDDFEIKALIRHNNNRSEITFKQK